jgi:hypothetical protein
MKATTHKGRIAKPRPVTEDWAVREYGLMSAELDVVSAKALKSGQELLASGQTVPWKKFKTRRSH